MQGVVLINGVLAGDTKKHQVFRRFFFFFLNQQVILKLGHSASLRLGKASL